MKETYVSASDDGVQLRRWFEQHYPSIGYGALQKMLRKKLIRLDGKRVEASQRLRKGQIIKHPEFDEAMEKPRPERPQKPDWLDDAILYQDEHLIILNKPSGLPTQGGSGQKTHLDRLLPLLQSEQQGAPRLVHRLDKFTSGCLVVARSAQAAEILARAFADRQIEKTYLALCMGVPSPQEGEIKVPLAKRVFGGEEKMAPAQDGKPARTRYRVIEQLAQRFSLVELQPYTGRKHQLRAHLAYKDCPILGDTKYAGEEAFPEGAQLPKKMHLHALRIHIPAECFGEAITVEAPLPSHFRESFDRLEIKYY